MVQRNPFIVAGIALVIGFGLGFVLCAYWDSAPRGTGVSVRKNSSEYRFTNPLLLTEVGQQRSADYKNTEDVIERYAAQAVTSGRIQRLSVYIRDLETGHWGGVNEDELYSPASMTKVAVLVAYLRKAETDPSLLSKKITIATLGENLDASQTERYAPTHPIRKGETYTAQQLLDAMIIDSDNNAAAALIQIIGQDVLATLYKDLRLPSLPTSTENDLLSPKMYSRFFRILYNSTYLSASLSEQTLDFLSRTAFSKGLVAGVGTTTAVSHKFGERTILGPKGDVIQRELHDCGIVYYPDHPYFVCVMTKGLDYAQLETAIASVSRAVWEETQKRHSGQ